MNNMTEPKKILVLTEQFTNSSPWFDHLRDAGYDVWVNETNRLPNEKELIDMLQEGVVATIAGGEPYTKSVFQSAPYLRIVARWGVGYDKVDILAATEAGIPIAMAFGQNHKSVAEFAHSMALALACRLIPRDKQVRNREWFFDGFHPGLHGRVAGLVGIGRIGAAFAKRLIGCDMRVLAFDPNVNKETALELGVELVEFDELLANSDLISLHTPSTPETRHLINAETLTAMKPGTILINTARGPLIDEKALVNALKNGHLGGAGLDVFESEPLPEDSLLRSFSNVILSPHVSGMDASAEKHVTLRCVKNILAYMNGDITDLESYVINPETLEKGA